MAADPMLGLMPFPTPVAASSPPASGTGGAGLASGSSHAEPGRDGTGRTGSAPQASASARPSSDQASASQDGSDRSRADSTDSKSRDDAGAAKGEGSRRTSPGGQTAQRAEEAAAASGHGATQAASSSAPGKDDFSAALARSLAATSAERTAPVSATAGAAAGKSGAESGKSEPQAHSAGHSATDPCSSALALLEHALAGALMGNPPVPGAATPSAAAAGGGGSAANGVASSLTKGAAALEAQLALKLPSDTKAGGSAPAPGAGQPSSSAATAAAALTAAQLTAAAHVGSQTRADAASMTLSSPVGSSAWNDELGGRLTWMAQQGIESASLQLSPEHLGPVQVSISVHNGQASVWFGAAQPDTRAALQQSLPQLRQLFANQGLTLADAGVSREPPRGQSRQSAPRGAAPIGSVGGVSAEGTTGRALSAVGLGLVDTYA
jgi:flagellar hook-length control protein FliK